MPFVTFSNHFSVELSNIPEGEYSFAVSVENKNETVTGKFKVVQFEVEQQFANSMDENLQLLASNTSGAVYYGNQETKLIEDLLSDERFKSIQKSSIIKTPLIEWKWILGLIILFLSIEWFVRKYLGEI